jgi:hypothetical protein
LAANIFILQEPTGNLSTSMAYSQSEMLTVLAVSS